MAALLIRADSGPAIGHGHVMRCLAIAEAVCALGHSCHLATIGAPSALCDRYRTAGVCVHQGDAIPASEADAAWTAGLIDRLGIAALVVDGHHFGPAYRLSIRSAAPRVLALDDLARPGPLHASIVVNPAPQATAELYSGIADGARFLLGDPYVPIRREIRHARQSLCQPVEMRRAVFVNFGGADPIGLTGPCLEALVPRLPEDVVVVAVVGAGCRQADRVAAVAGRYGIRVELHRNAGNMGALMVRCGLAITAGGGTAGELAALGVPAVLVVTADDQAPAAVEAARQGYADVEDARPAGSGPAERIAARALALWHDRPRRAELSRRLMLRIDGRGAQRIAEVLCGDLSLPAPPV